MMSLLAAGADSGFRFGELFSWWQLPLVLLVIALIVFWVMYRRRQM